MTNGFLATIQIKKNDSPTKQAAVVCLNDGLQPDFDLYRGNASEGAAACVRLTGANIEHVFAAGEEAAACVVHHGQ